MASPLPRTTRLSRRTLGTGAVATTAGIILSACANGGADGRQDGDGARDQVTMLTGFGAFGRDAYIWVARALGFFDEVNIDCTIEPGPGTSLNIAEVVSGSADFCVGDMTGAILVYDEGAEGAEEFVMVGAIHQVGGLSVMFRADSGIRGPADLEGMVIGDSPGSVGQLLFPAYAATTGIDASEVEFFQADPPQLPGLLATNQVDAVHQFVFGHPTVERAVGATVEYLPYGDEMPNLFGNVIMTRREIATGQPDLVRRFNAALLRGLEHALDHPEEAAGILADDVPEVDAETAAIELELMESYVRQPGVEVGSIDRARAEQAIALVEGVGAVREGIQPADLIDFNLVPGGTGG